MPCARRALRSDWRDVLAVWLYPPIGTGIERADFGFWINLASASLKEVVRIVKNEELKAAAEKIAGSELVRAAATIDQLRDATKVFDVARTHRNAAKGHGSYIKGRDAERIENELKSSVKDLYQIAASIFRRLQLVRTGMAEVMDGAFSYQIEILGGSDPTFQARQIEIDRLAASKALGFWMINSRAICRALPFFRLGLPQQPQESSFYVFNRIEKDGDFRWISYQESREQEFVAPDDELLNIITVGKNAS